MSNLHRGHSIDAYYQVLVHLAKRFQRRRFKKNQPIRNKNCLWWPCLLMDRDEMSQLYRGPSIDASYQISDQLALRFQRRRLKCEKLTDDGRQVMAKEWAKKRKWSLAKIWKLAIKNIYRNYQAEALYRYRSNC